MVQAAAPKATWDSKGELNEQHEGETYFHVMPVQTHAVILQQEKIQALPAHKGIVLGIIGLLALFGAFYSIQTFTVSFISLAALPFKFLCSFLLWPLYNAVDSITLHIPRPEI